MDQVPRSLRYIYQQNRSLHSTRLKNPKPCIDDRPSPSSFKKSLDPSGYFLNSKKRNSFNKHLELQNQKMSSRILNIMNSPRREIQVQGYSKYHCIKRGFMDIRGREDEKRKSIERGNKALGERIERMRPDVGSVREWEEHYKKFVIDGKIVKRKKGREETRLELQESSVGRQESSSCLDGKIDKDKIPEGERLSRFGMIKSEKLPYLVTDGESYSLRRKLSMVNAKTKGKQEKEREKRLEKEYQNQQENEGKRQFEKEMHTTRTQQILTK